MDLLDLCFCDSLFLFWLTCGFILLFRATKQNNLKLAHLHTHTRFHLGWLVDKNQVWHVPFLITTHLSTASLMSLIQALRSSLEAACTSYISGPAEDALIRNMPLSSLATSRTISFWREITGGFWSWESKTTTNWTNTNYYSRNTYKKD